MAFIKQEPLSDEQWDQLIANFESQPDAYFPETTFDLAGSFRNSITNESLGPVTDQIAFLTKTELIDPNIDWTFTRIDFRHTDG